MRSDKYDKVIQSSRVASPYLLYSGSLKNTSLGGSNYFRAAMYIVVADAAIPKGGLL